MGEKKRESKFVFSVCSALVFGLQPLALFFFLVFFLSFSASYRHVNDTVNRAPRLQIWLFELVLKKKTSAIDLLVFFHCNAAPPAAFFIS